MHLTHLVAFNIALLAAIASPGPAFLVAVKTALTSGRRAGIAVGLGLGLMAALWTAAALFGLEVVFVAFPWAYTIVKTIGALYLIWIAYGMWKGARAPLETEVKPARHAFRQGVLINLMNPKSVLFAAAVLVVIFPPDMTLAENLLVVGNHLIVEWIVYTAIAFGMSTEMVSQRYLRGKVWLDRAAASVLGALGIRLLMDR
ncbi:threonine/homoserine/homoserine lactone efflux protein [Shimia isoporae]|uniref:Threonine/homoserine/homoserine lactone efflux protein n=1 Tax=Shimia isoporae TaxID=647720 RepID=A0A4R1NUZ5_9RHOB|nr:LysE family translocator [Shimia isoporae]TCL09078.1 threonine/homoserine/homoserine lactone efflux protein [Shimia isoporae]